MSVNQAEVADLKSASNENHVQRVGSARSVAVETSSDNRTKRQQNDGCVVRLVATSTIDLCSESKLSIRRLRPHLPSSGRIHDH